MFRPEGWDEIKQSILEEPNGMGKWCCSDCGDKIVELTADAILEGLMKECAVLRIKDRAIDVPGFTPVLIPEVKE